MKKIILPFFVLFTCALQAGANNYPPCIYPVNQTWHNKMLYSTIMAEAPSVNIMSRFWMNLTDSGNGFSQAMIAYSDQTTLGIDYGYDGEVLNDGGNVLLYSFAENRNLSIQARPAFTTADVVPLGFRVLTAGQFTIAIDRFDGLFEGQNIYIKDNIVGVTRNLSNSYTFASDAGTFTDRFEIVYTTTVLDTDTPDLNNTIVYKDGASIRINTGNNLMSNITVYDLQGRKLYSTNTLNTTKAAITDLQAQTQVLIVEVTTARGKVSKKIIF